MVSEAIETVTLYRNENELITVNASDVDEYLKNGFTLTKEIEPVEKISVKAHNKAEAIKQDMEKISK